MKYSRNKINTAGKSLLAGPEIGFAFTDANLVVEDWRKLHMVPLEELVGAVTRALSQAGVSAAFSSYRLKLEDCRILEAPGLCLKTYRHYWMLKKSSRRQSLITLWLTGIRMTMLPSPRKADIEAYISHINTQVRILTMTALGSSCSYGLVCSTTGQWRLRLPSLYQSLH